MLKYNFCSSYSSESALLPFDHLINSSLPSPRGICSPYFIEVSWCIWLGQPPVWNFVDFCACLHCYHSKLSLFLFLVYLGVPFFWEKCYLSVLDFFFLYCKHCFWVNRLISIISTCTSMLVVPSIFISNEMTSYLSYQYVFTASYVALPVPYISKPYLSICLFKLFMFLYLLP